ncbi:MAG: hypothetical protein ACOC4M_04775 [Promethearchaeia archaeon]
MTIEPRFEITSEGKVRCIHHTQYSSTHRPKLKNDSLPTQLMGEALTCKTCDHYKKENCYFSRKELDHIDPGNLINLHTHVCKLCGERIHNMHSIVYKHYYEEKYNVDIPLICCDCYETLNSYNHNIITSLLSKSVKETSNLFFLAWIVFSVLFFMAIFSIKSIFAFGALMILFFSFSLWSLNRISKILKGLKFYKNNFKPRESAGIKDD